MLLFSAKNSRRWARYLFCELNKVLLTKAIEHALVSPSGIWDNTAPWLSSGINGQDQWLREVQMGEDCRVQELLLEAKEGSITICRLELSEDPRVKSQFWRKLLQFA